ncbi:MAG: hypothetical protein E3J70_05230 [Candidatus Heimdallarchaeota archaeon]|nr:MAG: hypothetical protein E3J70_05230 [Candidatus Heimdallarchaeota archaeon]
MKVYSNFLRKIQGELIFLAIMILMFFETLNSFLTNVYALNFAIMGIGPYTLLVVFFLSPPILLIFRKKFPTIGLYITAGLLIIARILMVIITNTTALTIITGFGVSAFSIFLPAYLVRTDQDQSKPLYITITQAFVIAICSWIALKAIGSSFDFSTYGLGRIISGVLVLVAILTLPIIQFQKEPEEVTQDAGLPETEKTRFGKVFLLSLGIYGIIAILWFALAYPSAFSRWSASSYLIVTIITIISFVSFFSLLTIFPNIFKKLRIWMIVVLNVVLLTSLVLVAALPGAQFNVVQQVFTYITAVLSPVALLDFMLLTKEINKAKPTVKQLGGSFGISSLLFMIVSFLMAISFNYEFVPLAFLFRDKVYIIILLTSIFVFIAVVFIKGVKGFTVESFKEIPKKLPKGNKIVSFVFIGIIIMCSVIGLSINTITPDTPSSPTTLRVMTYNVHQGEDELGQFNFERILATIRRTNPDIIAFQESEMARICFSNSDLVRYLATKLDMYYYYGPKTLAGTYGVSTLSKYPIISSETYFMPSADSQRVILKSEIRIGVETITFYNTHFGLSSTERINHAIFTRDLTLGSTRAFCLGDFNTIPTDSPYPFITTNFDDGWLAINPTGFNGTGYDGGTTPESGRRIDYILFTSDFTINSIEVLTWAIESDHYPVLAVFTYP